MAQSCLLSQHSVLLDVSCISPSGISDRHYVAPRMQLPPIQTTALQKAQRFFWNVFLWWQPRTLNRYVMENSTHEKKYSNHIVVEHTDKYKSRCQIQGDLNINSACGAAVSGQMVQLPEAEALRPSAPQPPHKAGSRLRSCVAAPGAAGEGG